MGQKIPSTRHDGRVLRQSLDLLDEIVGAEPAAPGLRRSLFRRCEAAADGLERLAKRLDDAQYRIARELAGNKSEEAVERFRRLNDRTNSALALIMVIVPALRHIDSYRARDFESEPIARATELLANVLDEIKES